MLEKETILKEKYHKNVYDIEELKNIKDFESFLRIKLYKDLSLKELKEIKRQIFNAQAFVMQVRDYYVTNEYGKIYFFKYEDYEYVLDRHEYLENPYFKIVKEADSFHSCTLYESDFPITIRNYHEGDFINMHYGRKRLSRYFIDHKINKYARKHWPVVVNAANEIVFVPQIGCDYKHYSIKPNFFMIECCDIEG